MKLRLLLSGAILFLSHCCFGQQPKYTVKHFAAIDDTSEFKRIDPKKEGFVRAFVSAHPEVLDIDDDNTTFVKIETPALLCFEGKGKNGKKQGVYNVYLIDSIDHSKRYKIWEQSYVDGQLNGQWKTYTLNGVLASIKTYKKDSLNGISRDYWIDGKTIMDEVEYFNGHNRYLVRNFYKNGKVKSEIPYHGGKLNGLAKKYYEDGAIQETVECKDDNFSGTRKYFYPNGQLWIEETYKNGKNWNIVASYTEKGNKRDAGTLHNGIGTIIYYNEDGTIRETVEFKNGDKVN